MDVNIARQSIYQAYLSLCTAHSLNPRREAEFRKLEGQMKDIQEKFDELVA